MQKIIAIVILSLISTNIYSQERTLVLPPQQSESDVSHDFYMELLKIILNDLKEHTQRKYKLGFTSKVMSQGRAEKELINNGKIDLYFMGTNKYREKSLTPVYFPILHGFLGTRLLLVNKKAAKDLDKVTTLNELKKFKACQATHWPDTGVLLENNLHVQTSYNYENLFRLLNEGRCDYFPRSIIEGIGEYQARKKVYKNILMNETLLLKYNFPMYFFFNKKDYDLAKDFENSLYRLGGNGKIISLLKKHQATRMAFPLKKWTNYKIIELSNSEYIPPKKLSNDHNFDEMILKLTN